jgi:hypothetical protein
VPTEHAGHAGHGVAPAGHHDKHAGHSVAMFRDRFWLSVLLTIPVLVWSEVVQEWLGFTAPSFPLSDRIPAILGSVVLLYGGLPFLRGGVGDRRRLRREPRIRGRRPRPRVLVGTCAPDRRPASRSLAGDESARAGLGRPRRARRLAAG